MRKPETIEDFQAALGKLRSRFAKMQPELELTVRDPELDVEGYVVVWNTGVSRGGPLDNVGKGGTRVTKDLTLDQVKRLARAMAEKNAAAGLPMGGAKSGLRADPSDPSYETKYRRFVQLCAPILHENGGIFGGFGYDVGGVPPKNAIWACDQLGSTRSFTGKPLEMGGTNYDVEGLAGLGVAVAARTLLQESGVSLDGKTFSVQGVGAMGSAVIRYFTKFGGRLKTFSDPKYGGTWSLESNPSSFLLSALIEQREGDVRRALITEGSKVSEDPAAALYADVDVLFPCAMEDALSIGNVDRIRARFIAEGANNATTPEAHKALFEKSVKIVPDIIANSGGIIAAYVELTSKTTSRDNATNYDKVNEAKSMIESRIVENVKALVSLTSTLDVQADHAGDYIAYYRIFEHLGFGTTISPA